MQFHLRSRPLLKRSALLLALLFPAIAPAASPPEENVSPGINSHYQNPNFKRWQAIFERDGREVWDRKSQVLDALALKPGMHVADIGAGTGFYSRMFARAVGDEGRVFSVDIARGFIEPGLEEARRLGFNNIVGVVNHQKSVELAPNSIDLAFISDTYHHFEYPRTLMKSLFEAIKPGGEVIIIDFIRRQGFSSPWIMSHVRADKRQVITEVESVGFQLTGEEDFMQAHYFLRMSKPVR